MHRRARCGAAASAAIAPFTSGTSSPERTSSSGRPIAPSSVRTNSGNCERINSAFSRAAHRRSVSIRSSTLAAAPCPGNSAIAGDYRRPHLAMR